MSRSLRTMLKVLLAGLALAAAAVAAAHPSKTPLDAKEVNVTIVVENSNY